MASNEPTWHPEADVDAEEAKKWYEQRSTSAARGFVLAVDAGVRAILEAPERWPQYRHGCRRYVLRRYPYNLIYRTPDGVDVEIVAVAHQKRRPTYWRDR